MEEEKSVRWERYRDSISKARKNYLSDKKTITVVVTKPEHEEIRAYCDEHGYSIQELIKEVLMNRVRS